MTDISREQLLEVIADFLEMGHVENIIAMFRQDHACFALTGELVQSERFMVRMGVAVLFEELRAALSQEILDAAIPSLVTAMGHAAPYVRGDAAYVLGIIGSQAALAALAPFQDDQDAQVADIVREALVVVGA